MIVLGIETSTVQASVALASEQGVIGSCVLSRGQAAGEFVLPATAFLLEKTGLSYENVAGVAIGTGPGLFTGMRIGVATAKTLAQALSVPIVATPSLDVLAFDCRYTNRIICPMVDAKRDEVFFALYRQVPGGIARITEYMVGGPRKFLSEIEGMGGEALVIGNGALLNRRLLEELGRVEFGSMSNAFPRASSLVELALPRFFREDYDALFDVEPMYMKRSSAEIRWDSASRGRLG